MEPLWYLQNFYWTHSLPCQPFWGRGSFMLTLAQGVIFSR